MALPVVIGGDLEIASLMCVLAVSSQRGPGFPVRAVKGAAASAVLREAWRGHLERLAGGEASGDGPSARRFIRCFLRQDSPWEQALSSSEQHRWRSSRASRSGARRPVGAVKGPVHKWCPQRGL